MLLSVSYALPSAVVDGEKECIMADRKPSLQINLTLEGEDKPPPLQAYVFTAGGEALGSVPIEENTARLAISPDLDGRKVRVVIGPRPQPDQATPSLEGLKRLGLPETSSRVLINEPVVNVSLAASIIPLLCFCHVRGRLVKRVTLPDGTIKELSVCNARVNICEVDPIPWLIEKLPDPDLFRLRDELLEKIRKPWPPPPPPEELFPQLPGIGPVISSGLVISSINPAAGLIDATLSSPMLGSTQARASLVTPKPQIANFGANLDAPIPQEALLTLSSARSAVQLRHSLIDLSDLIRIYICDLIWLWRRYRVDCVTTVETDEHGHFDAWVFYRCGGDKPDLYFWIEQIQHGVWTTVYRPSVPCHTYWDFNCSQAVTINVPGAVGCEDPSYDLPPGVTLFVLPYAIGSTPIWGKPSGSSPAPDGWVRTDGYSNYVAGGLGMLYNAPFGGSLVLIHDDSYFIPSSTIKYYRYSYRRVGSSGNWTPIAAPLSRVYRMEYNDRLPTYESYPVGPFPIGAQSNLFEFKPIVPLSRPTDPASVVAREWTSGNLNEAGAVWDTLTIPSTAFADPTDPSGDFEVRLEVFGPTGAPVAPGAATFQFLLQNADRATTRLAVAGSAADPMEVFGDAFHFRVHVDNNGVEADLPQPSVNGVGADPNCGFLFYDPANPADDALIRFRAAHRHQHAVFGFSITRGSNAVPNASTPPSGGTSNNVEVASAVAPLSPGPGYALSGTHYQRTFEPTELVGICVNAAFAASLGVYGKATNGSWRLGYDASRLIAFALAKK